MSLYLPRLLQSAKHTRSGIALDLAVTYTTPVVQFISLGVGLATLVLNVYGIYEFALVPATNFLVVLALGLLAAFAVCSLLAAFVVHTNRPAARGTAKGILYFAFFLLSWMPIGIISLFKRQKTWDPIAHTRSVSVHEMA